MHLVPCSTVCCIVEQLTQWQSTSCEFQAILLYRLPHCFDRRKTTVCHQCLQVTTTKTPSNNQFCDSITCQKRGWNWKVLYLTDKTLWSITGTNTTWLGKLWCASTTNTGAQPWSKNIWHETTARYTQGIRSTCYIQCTCTNSVQSVLYFGPWQEGPKYNPYHCMYKYVEHIHLFIL